MALRVAVVPAVSTGAGGGPYAGVTGSGWRGNVTTPTHFEVSAHDGSQGVSGTYASINAANPLLNFRGDVTCLYVSGDHAVVGGVVDVPQPVDCVAESSLFTLTLFPVLRGSVEVNDAP